MTEKPPISRIARFRNAFFSGLLLLAPLGVTVWAFTGIIGWVGKTFRPLFFFYVDYFLPVWLAKQVALWNILTTIIMVLLITALGYVSRRVFARYFLGAGERFVQSIPGVNAVYNTVKQIVETFSAKNRNLFSKVVLVEFPRKGTWCIGFITNKAQGEPHIKTAADGQEVLTVFVPTAPNPTSGFLILIPTRDVQELEMSVGDGMKMIISGGGVVPDWPVVTKATSLQQ